MMQLLRPSIFATLVLAFAPDAFCLDQSAAITVTTILETANSWDGQPLQYPAGDAEITGMIIEIAPGGETGWHAHPVPSFGMIMEGELEVKTKEGGVKRLATGEALAEVVGTLHNGRSVGEVPVKLVVCYAGAVGQKLTIKSGEQQ